METWIYLYRAGCLYSETEEDVSILTLAAERKQHVYSKEDLKNEGWGGNAMPSAIVLEDMGKLVRERPQTLRFRELALTFTCEHFYNLTLPVKDFFFLISFGYIFGFIKMFVQV